MNEFAPELSADAVNLVIEENSAVAIPLTATDADTGNFGRFTFHLLSTTSFAIDEDTGKCVCHGGRMHVARLAKESKCGVTS